MKNKLYALGAIAAVSLLLLSACGNAGNGNGTVDGNINEAGSGNVNVDVNEGGDADTNTGANTNADTGAGTDADAGADTGTDTNAGTGTGTDTEADKEPVTTPAEAMEGYLNGASQVLTGWGSDLEKRTQNIDESAQQKVNALMAEYGTLEAEVQAELEKLGQASEETWAGLQAEVEAGLDKLQAKYDEIIAAL